MAAAKSVYDKFKEYKKHGGLSFNNAMSRMKYGRTKVKGFMKPLFEGGRDYSNKQIVKMMRDDGGFSETEIKHVKEALTPNISRALVDELTEENKEQVEKNIRYAKFQRKQSGINVQESVKDVSATKERRGVRMVDRSALGLVSAGKSSPVSAKAGQVGETSALGPRQESGFASSPAKSNNAKSSDKIVTPPKKPLGF